ncbi:DNA end-binding protein Ku [Tahibacter aquaticus]|uniref:Non-homologous end joining protein Ku n=1 Tax=Tahibacter aquaticus TaxID=520092 RepID=A0A4V3DME2_9GAMM|nr:Ku protein [Tahibacter aquaticus]TDR44100.1 DNA end-binding protein Ku [Tahibacter aquaticus]
MARPIWNGTLSFGLLHIPVAVMSGQRSVDLHFRMLDARNKKPVRYERVNADTGREVPWKDIVKAYEYRKGSYVVLEPQDIKSAAPESHETIDLETFVDATAIGPEYFEKPYYLIPGKRAEKGYVLLRQTLEKTGRIGIGRVVIRTREHLCAVIPRGKALLMNLLRYPAEVIAPEEFPLPATAQRVSRNELAMAEKLVESLSGEWKPDDFRDEFRERLQKVIDQRLKNKKTVDLETEHEAPEEKATNVVDFVSLLKQSLADNKRTPATKSAAKKPAAKKSSRKAAGRRKAS